MANFLFASAGLAAGIAAGCALVVPPMQLFPASHAVERIDFEETPPNQLPNGLESTSSGRWAVADSPSAVSGTQVVVRRGDEVSELEVTSAAPAARVGGEVSLRVLIGPAGAGIACDNGEGRGYVLKAEPGQGRIALYRKTTDGTALRASEVSPVEKGKWIRLGIRCEDGAVVGYLDGKAVVDDRAPLGPTRLALWADGGVTAQFDDFIYAIEGLTE